MTAETSTRLKSRRGLASSGLIALLGSVVNGAAAFGVVIAITRGLGDAHASGAVFTAMAVFNIVFIVCTLGAEVAVVRAVARDDVAESAIVATALKPTVFVSVLAAAGLILARESIAEVIGGDDQSIARATLLAVGLFIPAASVTSVLMATTRGRGTMTPTAIVERISRPGMQVVLLGFAGIVGAGAGWFALLWSATFGLALGPAVWWYRAGLPQRDNRSRIGAGSTYWNFAAPFALTTVFQVVLRWADIILVAALADASTAAVYTAASRLLLAGNFLNLAIVQAISPLISNALARGDKEEARDLLRTGTGWLVAAVWPGYLLLVVFGGAFLGLFGPGYETGGAALAILAGAMLIASAAGPIEAVLLMSGRSRLSLANNAAAVGLNITLNVILIPRIGIEGAALAWAGGLLVTNLAPLVQVRRVLGIDPFGSGMRSAALTAVALVAVPAVAFSMLFDPSLPTAAAVTAVLVVGYIVGLARNSAALGLSDLASALRPNRAHSRSS